MEKTYHIFLSLNAENDLQKLLLYIKNKLKEPEIAQRYYNLLKNKIKTLEKFPKRFAIIDDFETRRFIIKNYSIFYEIDEKNKIVNIKRILYSASNWENKI